MQPINEKIDYLAFSWIETRGRYADGAIAMKFDGNSAKVPYAPWSFRQAENLVETGHWMRMPDNDDVPAGSEDAW